MGEKGLVGTLHCELLFVFFFSKKVVIHFLA
jgi:hypothetical protein